MTESKYSEKNDVKSISDTIVVLGSEYPVRKFTKAHLASLVYAFRRAITPSGQSQLAEALKRFFIPTLPNTIIEEDFDNNNQTAFYTFLIEFEDMGEIVEQVISIAKKRKLIADDVVDIVSIDLEDDEDDEPTTRKTRTQKAIKKGE